jgi:hypothetical protein
MMSDLDIPRVVRDIADLRMQVAALAVATKNESLPASVKEARTTVRWSAIVIAAALMASSVLRYCADERVSHLERRIDLMEKRPAFPASP